MDRNNIGGEGAGILECLQAHFVEISNGQDHCMIRWERRLSAHQSIVNAQLVVEPLKMGSYTLKQQKDQGNDDQHCPGTIPELLASNDHRHHTSSQCPYSVDDHGMAPALLSPTPPVPHHACLGNGEGYEHTNSVQWNE